VTDLFTQLITPVLAEEGGYTNNPNDAGGETNFGVTAAVARANGYQGPMASMTRVDALAVYRNCFWEKSGIVAVSVVSPRLAGQLLDCAVNMGVPTAAELLQRALNVLGPSVSIDGDLGPQTLAALKAYLARRGAIGETVLLKSIACLRGYKYIALAESNPNDKSFVFGWIANRVAIPA